ncbi:alpha/beta hydrolase [Novosphingobium subterraneum]|uniref:Dienelactone hydrolase n=1 Tax=Novosphingobium subterraneum TaxID=48936 RepID=A0A0B8ZTZ2_9SPHN|nr:alpha/beta hydrolase [Novosphingobium subterraneum]KHS46548.1 dienelactone hydrolase [Novosphingobium subterraneum]
MARFTPLAAFACAALVAAPTSAKTPAERSVPVNPEPSMADKFPQVAVAFPGGVKAWRDVTYQVNPGYRPQIVDIYVPAGKGPHPLVLYIHGGGWMGGHTRQSGAFDNFPKMLAAFAAEGFTVASVEYRLSGEATFPAQAKDIFAALRFLRQNAAQYHIDPSRVGVFGGSAGGHLAALTGLACTDGKIDATLDPASTNDGCVQATAAWYGIHDFATMPRITQKDSAEQRLLGCKDSTCTPEGIRAASPISYVDVKDAPVLLLHGVDDKVVPVGQSQQLEAALKAAGVPVSATYYPGIDHSFMGATPDDTRRTSLKAMNATFDFFHDKLGVPRK